MITQYSQLPILFLVLYLIFIFYKTAKLFVVFYNNRDLKEFFIKAKSYLIQFVIIVLFMILFKLFSPVKLTTPSTSQFKTSTGEIPQKIEIKQKSFDQYEKENFNQLKKESENEKP